MQPVDILQCAPHLDSCPLCFNKPYLPIFVSCVDCGVGIVQMHVLQASLQNMRAVTVTCKNFQGRLLYSCWLPFSLHACLPLLALDVTGGAAHPKSIRTNGPDTEVACEQPSTTCNTA